MSAKGSSVKPFPLAQEILTLACKRDEVQKHLMAAQTRATERPQPYSTHTITHSPTALHRCSQESLSPQGLQCLPSTVPILLVRTESVWSSQPPPLRPSLNLIRMDWLLNRTTRIRMAAVTVVECRCSSINIIIQSKPRVFTSSSQALSKVRGKKGTFYSI